MLHRLARLTFTYHLVGQHIQALSRLNALQHLIHGGTHVGGVFRLPDLFLERRQRTGNRSAATF
ncbi:hypothetical protein D3C74_324370 [compost metagenome]